MRIVSRMLRVLAPLALAMAVWYGLAFAVETARGVDFPTPHDAAGRLASLLLGESLSGHSVYRHIGASLCRWLVGFGIAALLGILVGLMAGWWQWLHDLVAPLLHVLQLIPGLAWIPVALLLFGVGGRATVSMIGITAFTPIAISIMDGAKRVDTTYVRAARMLGAGRTDILLHVLLPGALPALVTGLRVGLGNGWRVLVAAEMVVGTGTGLGYSIIEARWTLDYTSAFACIVVICGIGYAVERFVLNHLEVRTVKRWALARDVA